MTSETASGLDYRREIEHALSASDVDARPWREFPGSPGVREKILWEDEATGSYAGIMELEAGARVREHFHDRASHHLYVLGGSCELSETLRVVGPGAYAFVPPDCLHGIDASGPDGCRLFFLHLTAPAKRTPRVSPAVPTRAGPGPGGRWP